MNKRLFLLFPAALMGAVLSACGGSGTPAATPAASGAQWRLNAGASSHAQAFQGFGFYPNTITVDAGDTVTWTYPSSEPHTVTFLGASGTLPSPGDPNNPKPAGGSTYDGSTFTSSGFIAMGYSYSLTFTKPGTYTYYCLIHQPEMVGTVVVNPAGTTYPAQEDAYSAQAVVQANADVQAASHSLSLFPYTPGGAHIAAGISPGLASGVPPSTSSVMRFVVDTNVDDSTITIPAGATVTWTNQSNNAPHTVTFPVAGQPLPELPGDPFTPPMGGSTYDGSQVTNSGVLAAGQSYSLTFTKAGTYVYYCLFHDGEGMAGTIVVQ